MGIETILIVIGAVVVIAIIANLIKSKRSTSTGAGRSSTSTTTPAVDPNPRKPL